MSDVENKKEKIMNAALKIFQEKGAEKTVLMEAPIELFEKDYETGLD